MNFVELLQSRGLVQDLSDPELAQKLRPGDSFYAGFDPTSPYLHIGNLIQVIVMVHLARSAGLRPIALFGGATGAIGDPSGRSAERQLLDREVIDRNVANQRALIERIVERCGVKVDFVNNYDWTREVTAIEFLREIGKHFTVNYMLAKEVVKARIEGDGISFTEFSYMLLQANDFLHLYQTKQCRLQFGGSDQWGNITAGLELIRKKIQGDAFALSVPLLLDHSGKKFGKTAAGAVWIDKHGFSPYKFHQYWLNQADEDISRLLKVFTFLSDGEIADAEKALKESPEKRAAQRLLADQVCTLVHGADATAEAAKCAEVLFGGSLDGLPDQTLQDIFSEAPSSAVPRDTALQSSIIDLFVLTKLAPSKGEARRLVQSGGAYLNNERVSDPATQLKDTPAAARKLNVLRSGKKNYHLLQLVD